MTRLTFGAAALAAAMLTAVSYVQAAEGEAVIPVAKGGEGVTCYLAGCYDEKGAKVEKPQAEKSAEADSAKSSTENPEVAVEKLADGKRSKITLVARERGSRAKIEIDGTVTSSIASEARGAIAAVSAGKYSSLIARHASANGLSASFATAVIRVESNFRADARGSAGEIGLMQIKPATARMLGYAGSIKGLYDPETNLKWGMKYLSMAQSLGDGSVCGTVLKYNAGHAAKRMNPISAAYCSKVKRQLASS